MNDSPSENVHLVFLESGVVLSKRPYSGWREVQDDYDDYKASLGPWTLDELAEYFALDYTNDDAKWPFSRSEMKQFFDSDAETARAV